MEVHEAGTSYKLFGFKGHELNFIVIPVILPSKGNSSSVKVHNPGI
jgi:hypothetical protein